TFVDLDPVAGRFTFDIFEHEGGHTTEWARRAQAGDLVGITGPGSGEFPAGRDVLMAGDETALPALRRILEHSPADRRGDVLIEVGHADDILDLPHPPGIRLQWVVRARGETLWDQLSVMDAPEGPDRHVWVAGEQDLVRKARARFRREQGVAASEGYFANYWAS
ncbi:MAG: siderophore-interacting protein, partial [Pseudomonadota bacterium]|nr:siderophore-interacting protein [Pseudomonadota bacterium]